LSSSSSSSSSSTSSSSSSSLSSRLHVYSYFTSTPHNPALLTLTSPPLWCAATLLRWRVRHVAVMNTASPHSE
jgi:hypothetical protein